jgi:PAS domain-containing protein
MSEPFGRPVRPAGETQLLPIEAEPSLIDPAQHGLVLQHMQVDRKLHQIELEAQVANMRQALAEAESLKAKYADISDLLPVGVYTVSLAGQILEVNRQGLALFDAPMGLVLNRQFRMFFHNDALAPLELLFTTVRQTRRIVEGASLQLRNKSGLPQYVDVLARQARPTSEDPCIRIVLSNVTTLKRVREDVIRAMDGSSNFGALES